MSDEADSVGIIPALTYKPEASATELMAPT
jgi:hypothetical protein